MAHPSRFGCHHTLRSASRRPPTGPPARVAKGTRRARPAPLCHRHAKHPRCGGRRRGRSGLDAGRNEQRASTEGSRGPRPRAVPPGRGGRHSRGRPPPFAGPCVPDMSEAGVAAEWRHGTPPTRTSLALCAPRTAVGAARPAPDIGARQRGPTLCSGSSRTVLKFSNFSGRAPSLPRCAGLQGGGDRAAMAREGHAQARRRCHHQRDSKLSHGAASGAI